MGKFYLANKHKWFLHQAARDHRSQLREGNCLNAVAEVSEEVRFFYQLDGDPPRTLRISDHGQACLAVIASNGLVGYLDAESTAIIRALFREFPEFGNECPAVLVSREEFSGAHIIRLGLH